MKFLYPQFLFALFAIIIPIIIHLFNFQRYRKINFSNVTLLKEIKHSTKAKSNLKHILILISRILAITAIVLAFAQPYIPLQSSKNASKTTNASIFIDNSFSMENKSTEGRNFEIAREYGHKIVSELPNHINHQVLTNNFESNEQHLYPKAEINQKISNFEISANSQSLKRILKRQESALDQKPHTSFIISDFQKSQFAWEEISVDSNNQYILIPIEPAVNENVSVDSVWFTNPIHRVNQPEQIHFRIRNYSESDQKVRTTLYLNDQQKSFTNITVPYQNFIDTFMVYTNSVSGEFAGKIEIDDSPILFDNTQYFSFGISDELSILSVKSTQSSNFIGKAYSLEPYFNYEEFAESNLPYDKLNTANLVIIDEVSSFSSGMISSLDKYVRNGGHLIVVPNNNDQQQDLNSLLTIMGVGALTKIASDSSRIKNIDVENPIYKNVFSSKRSKVNLPEVYKYFNSKETNSPLKTSLLQTVNNQDILSEWEIGKGKLYLFTTTMHTEFSNFPKHSLFLPTFYEIAFQSSPVSLPYFTIGKDEFIPIKTTQLSNESLFHVLNSGYNLDIIPEIIPENNQVKLALHNSIQKSGNYKLTFNDSLVKYISFNYSRIESNPDFYSITELEEIIENANFSNFTIFHNSLDQFSSEFKKLETGIELWKWFVILALLFLAIEIVLIRYFKPSVL